MPTVCARLLTFFALLGCGLTAAHASPFSGLVLFGDSLTDVGNVHHQTFGISPQSPPYFSGRFSNGPLWCEAFAQDLGLPAPVRSRTGGRNYAYGGTKTGSGSTVFFPFSFPNIGSQINSYLSGNSPAASELFVVWGGGNDFIDGQSNPSVPVNNISNHITALANAGATQFLIPNLPRLGQVPRFRGTSNEAVMDSRSTQFNSLLASTLAQLQMSLDVQIWQLDVQELFDDLLSDPGSYGFTNTTDTALVGSTPAPNQDEYVFWDDIHPTRIAHGLLGSFASDLVNTHKWNTTQPGGSWSNPNNWDPQGVPGTEWIAHVINDNVAFPQAVAVDVNSTVQHVLVRGDTGPITLIVQSVAELGAGSVIIASQGSISLQGGTLRATTHVQSGGVLSGTGTVVGPLTNAGTVSPGEPGTVLFVDGNFVQGPTGRIVIELAGTSSGQHDRLDISALAALEGSLAVRLVDNFIALPGQSFLSMTFASRNGDLTIVNETGFAGLLFDKSYTADSLTLVASALGGDANLDGTVNLSDFNVLASNFGMSGLNWLGADFTGDGIVNLSDFNILASNFGLSARTNGPTPDEWSALASAIPEPSLAALILSVFVATLRRRHPSAERPTPNADPLHRRQIICIFLNHASGFSPGAMDRGRLSCPAMSISKFRTDEF